MLGLTGILRDIPAKLLCELGLALTALMKQPPLNPLLLNKEGRRSSKPLSRRNAGVIILGIKLIIAALTRNNFLPGSVSLP